MVTPTLAALTEIGVHRPLCQHSVRVAAGLATSEAQRAAGRRRKLGIPIDQCGHRGDFRFDGRVLCRAHAGQEALRLLLARQPRTDAEEIARPRCQCSSATVRRVLVEHGTCSMGGCPYGGDF